jgi:hypothetical protein
MSKYSARRIDLVTPGFYKTRKVRGGPWVGAQIVVTDGMVYVTEDGAATAFGVPETDFGDIVISATMAGEVFRDPIVRVAWFGVEISEAEYRHLLSLSAWAAQNQPDHPAAKPDKPIRMGEIPISFIV